MAGPTTGILLRTVMNSSQKRKLIDVLHGIDGSARWSDDTLDFTIKAPTPRLKRYRGATAGFTLTVQTPDSTIDAASLQGLLGFTPVQEVIIAAHSNDSFHHMFLGQLSATIASMLEGLIDLHGPLRASLPDAYNGRILEIPYQSAAGTSAVFHVVDVTFLEWWMRQPEFYMVK